MAGTIAALIGYPPAGADERLSVIAREDTRMGTRNFSALLAAAIVVVGLVAASLAQGHPTSGSAMEGSVSGGVSLFASGVLDGKVEGEAVEAAARFKSANFKRFDRDNIVYGDGNKAEGSDLAFRNRLMVAGTYQGTALYRISRNRENLNQISFHRCAGSQGDVTLQGNLVFVSVDSPGSNSQVSPRCNNTDTTGETDSPTSKGKEGIRIVDISNLQRPRQVGFVETECGSHTQTLIPGNGASYLYVDSYPLANAPVANECSELTHPEGEFSVIRIPDGNPERADVVAKPDVIPQGGNEDAVGCHDTGVLIRPSQPDLALCAGLGRWALLNIERPTEPRTLSVVNNVPIELDHSAQFSWDGKVAVIGDEHAGAAGGGGCSEDDPDDSDSTVGAMWFYDISNPRNPIEKDHHALPRVPQPDSPEEAERFRCTTHNYNIIPTEDRDRYLAAVPYYMGGLAVVDFSNLNRVREVAWIQPPGRGKLPDMWSGYWHNGRIYTNEHASQRGVSIFQHRGTGPATTKFFRGTVNPQTQIPRFR